MKSEMYHLSAFTVIVAIASLSVSAGVPEMISRVQMQQEFNTTTEILSSVSKLLLELKARRDSLQQPSIYPASCLIGNNHNTTITVQVPGHQPFPVLCNSELAGQGWLVIQRRWDGLVSFYRDWNDYKAGFGSLSGDFFIGLEKLHVLTAFQPFELHVYMENLGGVTKFAKYDEFSIGSESENYHLKNLGSYTGTAGDSLSYHKGQAFSTFDRDNDANNKRNCAQNFLGAWWFNSCVHSNLNAQYVHFKNKAEILEIPSDPMRYMYWNTFDGNAIQKLTFVQMMIRPKFGCPS